MALWGQQAKHFRLKGVQTLWLHEGYNIVTSSVGEHIRFQMGDMLGFHYLNSENRAALSFDGRSTLSRGANYMAHETPLSLFMDNVKLTLPVSENIALNTVYNMSSLSSQVEPYFPWISPIISKGIKVIYLCDVHFQNIKYLLTSCLFNVHLHTYGRGREGNIT